ncbi:MAG: OsmC family protein [Gemmatimonadetes bacterium]|nr:OsmC family protein [Gemmatimonadota bacterium]
MTEAGGPPAPGLRVRSFSRGHAVQEIEARDHRWLADLARGDGGHGLGPTPLELLLGSFAAHTAIGILALAREKEWAIDAVEVEVAQESGGRQPSAELLRQIVVRGELDDAERRELEGEVGRRWPRAGWLEAGNVRDTYSYD